MRSIFLLLALLLVSPPSWPQSESRMTLSSYDTAAIYQQIQAARKIAEQEPDSGIRQLNTAYRQSQQAGYPRGKIWALIELTHIYLNQSQYQEAQKTSQAAIVLCDTNLHRKELSYIYINIGKAYYNTARFEQAFQENQKAIQYASAEPQQQAGAYNNQANILRMLQRNREAITYNQKALAIARTHDIPYLQAMQYVNIANGYLGLRDTIRSLQYYDSAIQFSKAEKFNKLLDFAATNKAIFLLQLDSAARSLALLRETEPYIDKNRLNQGVRYKAYGIIYTALAQFETAKAYLDSAGPLVDAVDSQSLIMAYAELYEKKGDYRQAFTYYKLHRALTDTAQKYQVQDRVTELNVQYQTAEKDKEIAEQRLLVARQQNGIQQRNTWILGLGSAALLISISLLYLYRNSQHKRRMLATQQENLQLRALMRGEEKERKRLSAELHDGIGGLLSAAKMSFSDLYLQQEENEVKYQKGIGLLDEAYRELRNTAHNLSPEILQSQGLIVATEAFCQNIGALQGIHIRLRHDGRFDTLYPELALNAYRIIQELLHNVVKHSQATEVVVELRNDADGLSLSIEDNGIGISPDTAQQGIGMHNLQHRIEAFNGTMEIDSRPGEGTTIYIQLG